MPEEKNGLPQGGTGENNSGKNGGRNKRRRGGHNRRKPEEKRADRTSEQGGAKSDTAANASQPTPSGDGSPRRRGKNGRGAPARRLSPNVIMTDADERAEDKPNVRAPEYDTSHYLEIPDHWFDEEPVSLPAEPQEMTDIVGVRFKDSGKVYYFAPTDYVCREGMDVIVETARGIEYGTIAIPNKKEPVSSLVAPLRPVVRIATDADRERHEKNREREEEAFRICARKIEEHGLGMKLVEAEYAFDNSKLTFFFSADGRVDFRELVKDLASVFRTRIELRQIGIRDEAKLLGGIGICGRPFCCSTFLYDFNQVSIRMAKEQNLSLNSAKISGTCGRLMCCLRYENDTYEAEAKLTPRVDSIVKTKDGTGYVIESQTLAGIIKVRLGDADDAPVKTFTRDEVTVIGRRRSRRDGRENDDNESDGIVTDDGETIPAE